MTEEETKKPNNVIIGGGSTGKFVGELLKKEDRDILIIDSDPSRVEYLRNEGFETHYGEITGLSEINKIDFSETEVFFILTPDVEENKKAMKELKEINPESVFIVRVNDLLTKKEFEEMGAEIAIIPSKIFAENAIREIQDLQSKKKSKKLFKIIKNGSGKLGIFVHSNPDPDSISAAIGLKKIAEEIGRETTIVYSGEIGHQENRAFVNLLGIELKRFEEVGGVEGFDQIALVDSAIPGDNNALPRDTELDIVIDHHEVDVEEINADFVDIRTDVGSTSTILTKYFQELDLGIDEKTATAFLFGIRTDTLELKRNAKTADFTAASYLYQLADNELLRNIESQAMDAETLGVLGDAIKNRKKFGSYLISNIGETGNKDALPQAADYLIKLEGVSTAVVFGVVEDTIHVSARNTDVRVNLGQAIREAYEKIGSAGGHQRMAGAQIPTDIFGAIKNKEVLMEFIEKGITRRFRLSVGN